MILAPDEAQAAIYRTEIAPHLKKGAYLAFGHGFNIHFGQITAPAEVDVSMIAPKAPGHRVRELYTEGVGVPALVAIHQDASGKALENSLAYARALGCLKAGVIETDFREELSTLSVPTLIIQGDADASAPLHLTGTRTAELIPGCRLHVYENAPHGLYLTHRERVNRDLLAFIDTDSRELASGSSDGVVGPSLLR